MRRIAILIHQYGDKIVGGAERYAKELAEHLSQKCEITVLTTASSDYTTWADDYPIGSEIINGVNLIRFSVSEERNTKFGTLCGKLAPILDGGGCSSYADDYQWSEWEGPNCPDMIEYIQEHHDSYDAFIVITYIYYIAIKSLPIIGDKAIFIPTAHDETWLKLEIMKDLFLMPKYFGFLTEEERNLVHERFHNLYIPSDVLGIGIDLPKDVSEERFRTNHGITEQYLIYVGRLDAAKGVDEMVRFFVEYKKEHPSDLKLVLVGTGNMQIPNNNDIITTGYVTNAEKYDAISGALAMITPSRYESLCISLLEAMALKIPVIANAKCAVLKGQCIRSNAGLYYDNEYEFFAVIDYILEHDDSRIIMGENGWRFVSERYTWPCVVDKVLHMVDEVDEGYSLIHNMDKSINVEEYKIYVDSSETQFEPIWDDAITIVTSSDNYYADYAGITINSIVKYAQDNRNYDIIVLTNDITDKKIMEIHSLINDKPNISVRYAYLSPVIRELDIKISENYNEVTYFRLLAPQMMRKYHKMIYLDSDVIVRECIDALWDIDIGDNFLAGTWDSLATSWQTHDTGPRSYFQALGIEDVGRYIQAGVIVINITKLNEAYEANYLIRKSCDERWLLADQDILNVYCKNRIKYIDHAWNVRNYTEDVLNICKIDLPRRMVRQEIKAMEHPRAIHYCESSFPCWKTDRMYPMEYWETAWGTIFYDHLISRRVERIEELIKDAVGKKNKKKIRDTKKAQFELKQEGDAVGVDILPHMKGDNLTELKPQKIIIHPNGGIYGPGMQLGNGIHRFFITASSTDKEMREHVRITSAFRRILLYDGVFCSKSQNTIVSCDDNQMEVEVLIHNSGQEDIVITKLFL